MKLLVLNSGSSSLRFKFYESKGWKRLFSGHIDGIGLKNCRLRGDIETKVKAKNHTQALKIALAILQESGHLTHPKEIEAVGHRVVHGGEKYHNPTRITRTVLKDLKKLSDLAPLHNPPNIQGVTACQNSSKKQLTWLFLILVFTPPSPNTPIFTDSPTNYIANMAFANTAFTAPATNI